MKIRPVRPGDRDEWLRLRRSLYGTVPADEVDRWFDSSGAGGTPEVGVAVYVAERENGCLGGFVEIGLRSYAEGCESSPVPYLEGWFVDPDLRGNGLGRALAECAASWARQRGYAEIASDAGIDDEPSHRAHAALGYIEVERQICFRKTLRG